MHGAAHMSIEVLLVEDNPGDARLTREAFRAVNDNVHVSVAADGVEAMAFLRKEGLHIDAPRPALILLDLNLPRMSGREVLACIKEDQELRAIPTIVLSSSDADLDIHMANLLQASCYVTKPPCRTTWTGSSVASMISGCVTSNCRYQRAAFIKSSPLPRSRLRHGSGSVADRSPRLRERSDPARVRPPRAPAPR